MSTVDAPWRRLSRRMLLVHPVHELLRLLPLVFALVVFGRGETSAILYGTIAATAALGLGAVRWLTTEYRVTAEQIQIRKGVLQRSVSSVALDRVRAVDVTARVMHRLVGLSVVTIGTGRSDAGPDGALRLEGLTADETAWLRAELLHRDGGDAAAPTTEGTPEAAILARWRTSWVRYGPLSFSGFITLSVVAGGAAQAIAAMGGVSLDTDQFGAASQLLGGPAALPVALVAAALTALLVLVALVLSAAGYLVAHWKFTLTREPTRTLHVTRGLLTTRATTLEERRLRGLELGEPLPLRLAGGARLTAIATGGDAGPSALLLPPAPREQANTTAALVLQSHAPLTAPLDSHGSRARRRRYTRALGPAAGLSAAGAIAVAAGPVHPGAWALATAVLLAAAALLAADRARSLGHGLVDRWLITRSGSLQRDRVMLERDGIIGVTLRSSYFQRRAGLCTLTATTAGGRQGYDVLDIEPAVAVRLAQQAVPGLLAPFIEATRG